MKNFPKFLILILPLLLLAGCHEVFNAESNVREDGTIERTVTYEFSGSTDQAAVEKMLDLPEGGEWKEIQSKDNPPRPLRQYTRHAVYAPDVQPASDFKRYDESRQKFARNQFQVRVHDDGFFRHYEYEERFLDIKNKTIAESFIQGLTHEGTQAIEKKLGEDAKTRDKAAAVAEAVRAHYIEIFKKYLDLFFDEDGNPKPVNEATLQLDKLEEQFLPEKAESKVVAKFPEFKNDPERTLLRNALQSGVEAAQDYWDHEPGRTAFLESVNGIYGLINGATFSVRVRIPGEVLRTNAMKKEKGVLIWKFQGSRLDQTLKIESRRLSFLGLLGTAMAIVAVMILVLALMKLVKKKNKKSKKKNLPPNPPLF